MSTMIAARLHAYGSPMTLDRIAVPEPRPTDVLVEVKACGVVPNLARVVSNFFGTQVPDLKIMPPLPAIFGLDPTGVVAKVGEQVSAIRPGERVYVNPARSCGSCRMCRSGQSLDCPQFTFQGYFGRSQDIMRAYPYGGLAQYITAPATALVRLPDSVTFEAAARFGYFGTAYAAMRKIGVGPGQSLLIKASPGSSGSVPCCWRWRWAQPKFSAPGETPRCSIESKFSTRNASTFWRCRTLQRLARRLLNPTRSSPGRRLRPTVMALTA
jgi:D-arabinose 1-dehydrogenase-like Zn-dependent alcohol dehydrogenase